jgi:hypothetical protein
VTDLAAILRSLTTEARAEPELTRDEAALTEALEAAADAWPTHRCPTVEAVARFAAVLSREAADHE